MPRRSGMGAVTRVPTVRCRSTADLLHEGQLVVDAVYLPSRTPLLAAAEAPRARRRSTVSPMLVHQAAIAFELLDRPSRPSARDARRGRWGARRRRVNGPRPVAHGCAVEGAARARFPSPEIRFAAARRGGLVGLQGDLTSFDAADVLRLLSWTKKSGTLDLSGDRGTASSVC